MIKVATALRLADVFWPEFVQHAGCVFLSREYTHAAVDLTSYEQLTLAETFVNHVHITDLFRHAIPGFEHAEHGYWVSDDTHVDFARAWQLGERLAQMWAAKLAADFSDRAFRVYLTRRDTPILRFHTMRMDEPSWLSEPEIARGVESGDLFALFVRASA